MIYHLIYCARSKTLIGLSGRAAKQLSKKPSKKEPLLLSSHSEYYPMSSIHRSPLCNWIGSLLQNELTAKFYCILYSHPVHR
jgi:hypothetical protein